MRGHHLTSASLFLMFAACGPLEETTETTATVVGGARTLERPEIGKISGCTATLIRSNMAITAAHCLGYRSRESEGSYGTIRFDLNENESKRYTISKYKSFGSSLGYRDVTLLKLSSDVPANLVTPASLATQEPTRGTPISIWGYGCTNQSRRSGGGVKRKVDLSYGRTDNLCPGDSGGPATVGVNGAIWGINSSYGSSDGFGRPYRILNEINQKISEWGGREAPPGIDPDADLEAPRIEIIRPLANEARQEYTIIEIEARITDDLHLTRSELVWDYNGKRYGCPSNTRYVQCSVQQDVFIWRVEVSTGERKFHIETNDIAGNQTVSPEQTISLTPNGVLPPEQTDFEPPAIIIVSPQANTQVQPQSNLSIVAQITDASSLEEVSLAWDFNGNSYGCPTQTQYVNCTVSGDLYTWVVRIGSAADRPFRIKAKDAAGYSATTNTQTIKVGEIVDVEDPLIEILSPTPGTAPLANSAVEVNVRITDNISVQSVSLDWTWYNGETYGCPTRSRYVDCDVVGDEYRWRVTVSSGERRFKIQANDAAGNRSISPEQSFTLQN